MECGKEWQGTSSETECTSCHSEQLESEHMVSSGVDPIYAMRRDFQRIHPYSEDIYSRCVK